MTDHRHHAREPEPAEPGYPEHPDLEPVPEAMPAHHQHHPAPRRSPTGSGRPTATEAHDGHDKHAGHSVAMFRDKFWISFLLTIPTLVWGHMLPRALGYTAPAIPGARWIPPVLGTAVFFYGGLPFIQGAWRELRDRLP